MLKIKELEDGMIIWKGNDEIVGITGATLPKEYYEMYCKKVEGNRFDYQLVEKVK